MATGKALYIVVLVCVGLIVPAVAVDAPIVVPTAVPVKIIFDTDMIGDYDDVGAMAVLHKLPDRHSPRACGLLASPAWECR